MVYDEDSDDTNEDDDVDNDDDDDDGQDDHDVMQAVDEDDIFDPNEIERICTEAISILQDRLDFFSLSCDHTIPLFVQLAIDFKSFHDEEREGVFIEGHPGNTVWQYLVASTDELYTANHHQLVDTPSFAVWIRLRQSGYFVHDDIQQYRLDSFTHCATMIFVSNTVSIF